VAISHKKKRTIPKGLGESDSNWGGTTGGRNNEREKRKLTFIRNSGKKGSSSLKLKRKRWGVPTRGRYAAS